MGEALYIAGEGADAKPDADAISLRLYVSDGDGDEENVRV
jgi:hypothetical protein